MSLDTIVPPIVLISAEADEVRAAVARTLKAYGVRQLEAASRLRTLEAAARIIPDVILLVADQQLKDPAELIRRLRADPTTRDTPIVVRLSANGRATSDTLMMAGADRVLAEGPESAALAGSLFRLADVSAQRRAVREIRRHLAPLAAPTIARLTSALQQSKMTMIAADSNARCVAMNDGFAAATALSREDVIGHPLWNVIQSSGGRDLRANWSTLLVVGSFQATCMLKRKYAPPAPADIYISAHVLRDVHVAAIRPATA